MKEYKTGDKVRRIRGEHAGMKVGDIATVSRILDYSSIELNGYSGLHDGANLEIVDAKSDLKAKIADTKKALEEMEKELEKAETPQFKVGDRVVCISSEYGSWTKLDGWKVGDVSTIREYESDSTLPIKLDRGLYWLSAKDFQLAPLPKFNVGDRVKYVRYSPIDTIGDMKEGTVFVVKKIEPSGMYSLPERLPNNFWYKDGNGNSIPEPLLELAPKEEWKDVTQECIFKLESLFNYHRLKIHHDDREIGVILNCQGDISIHSLTDAFKNYRVVFAANKDFRIEKLC